MAMLFTFLPEDISQAGWLIVFLITAGVFTLVISAIFSGNADDDGWLCGGYH